MSNLLASSTSNRQNRKIQYRTTQIQAQRKYGEIKIPTLHPDFVQRRIILNNMLNFKYERSNVCTKVVLSSEMLNVIESVSLKPLVVIDDDVSMNKMIDHLSQQVEIAIDTEFDTTHFFRDIIAVIQISSHKIDYILDPLIFFSIRKS